MELIHVPTQTIIHKIDDGAAKALLLLAPEAFKRTEPKPTPAANQANGARWSVQKHRFTDLWEIVRVQGSSELRYPGPQTGNPNPADARAAFAACGFPVPQELIDLYATKLGLPTAPSAQAVFDAGVRKQFEADHR